MASSSSSSLRTMRPEERAYLAYGERNSFRRLLPRVHADLGLRREHRAFHGNGVWMRRDVIRQDEHGRLLKTLYFVTGEGSWSLRPHERVVIEAVIDTLPEHSQALLRSQLNGTMFVQRSHKQISRPRFYTAPYLRDRRAIEGGEYSHKVIDVLVDVDGVNEVAQVEFFRGRVDSIQFKRPAAYYVGKRLRVTGTRPGKPTRSHAAAIDRREHGAER